MRFPDLTAYLSADTLMGPASVCILKELLARYPLQGDATSAVLDLGCGKGLTSLALAKAAQGHITAADLWIPAEENRARFENWGVGERVTAVHADARELPFAPMQFDALVSVDAYHYFGTGETFFAEHMLKLLKDGARVLIGVPGIKDAFAHQAKDVLFPWLQDEYPLFQSPAAWKGIIGSHPRIKRVETWEMACFEEAWEAWFASGHPYARGDQQFYEPLIAPYTCFVGILVEIGGGEAA